MRELSDIQAHTDRHIYTHTHSQTCTNSTHVQTRTLSHTSTTPFWTFTHRGTQTHTSGSGLKGRYPDTAAVRTTPVILVICKTRCKVPCSRCWGAHTTAKQIYQHQRRISRHKEIMIWFTICIFIRPGRKRAEERGNHDDIKWKLESLKNKNSSDTLKELLCLRMKQTWKKPTWPSAGQEVMEDWDHPEQSGCLQARRWWRTETILNNQAWKEWGCQRGGVWEVTAWLCFFTETHNINVEKLYQEPSES